MISASTYFIMTKQEIRKTYLERRLALSEAEYSQFNFQLYQTFFSNVDLSFVKVFHIFLSIETRKEPDSWMILDRVRREFPNIRLSVPRVNASKGELENFYFEGLHQLATNSWGIQEPRQGVPTEIEKIDLVLVPLLAFDRQGHRLGYGKGYYDKFLAGCKPECKKTGVSFFPPLQSLPHQPHDIQMDGVITPSHYYEF